MGTPQPTCLEVVLDRCYCFEKVLVEVGAPLPTCQGKPGSTKLLGNVGNWKQALPEVPLVLGSAGLRELTPPGDLWWFGGFATIMLVVASRFVCVSSAR